MIGLRQQQQIPRHKRLVKELHERVPAGLHVHQRIGAHVQLHHVQYIPAQRSHLRHPRKEAFRQRQTKVLVVKRADSAVDHPRGADLAEVVAERREHQPERVHRTPAQPRRIVDHLHGVRKDVALRVIHRLLPDAPERSHLREPTLELIHARQHLKEHRWARRLHHRLGQLFKHALKREA